MRIYGDSPLHHYIELIFRSKKLFIISVILATIGSVLMYTFKAGTYSASALILLSGTDPSANAQSDVANERGSVRYKLNVLSIVVKDPDFIKNAMHDASLDHAMSAEQFDTFCKNVKTALTYTVNENVLEISCKWPDDRAANIVKAFYSAYNHTVLNQETIVSTGNTKLLESLMSEYAEKEHAVKKRVAEFKQKNALNQILDPDAASSRYSQMQATVQNTQNNVVQAQQNIALLSEQLSQTSEQLTLETVKNGVGNTPAYKQAQQDVVDANIVLNKAKDHYTDRAPQVIKAQKDLDEAQKRLDIFESAHEPKDGPTIKTTTGRNPEYQNIKTQLQQSRISLSALQTQLKQQQQQLADAKAMAEMAPKQQYNSTLMTEDLALFSTIHQTLRSKLEQAKIDERKDRELKLAEMQMLVSPESESDKTGAKSKLIILAGPLLGLIIGFVCSLLFESQDHTLRTPQEVERFLHKPVLAVLPQIPSTRESRRRIRQESTQSTVSS